MQIDKSCYQDKNPLVTIVIPVYKVEAYLAACLDSVIEQTYRNLEILVIDDGSPDKSGDIAENYARQDARIRVIHKKNGGLSDVRNVGTASAKGTWLMFIDSDDTVPNNAVEILLKGVLEAKVPISVGAYDVCIEDAEKNIQKRRVSVPNPGVYSGEALIKYFLCSSIELEYLWTKLFHIRIFDNFQFPYGKLFEDTYANPRLLHAAGSAVLINEPVYNYYQRPNSLSRQVDIHKQMHSLSSRLSSKHFIDSHYPDLKKYTGDMLLNTCCFLYDKIDAAGAGNYKKELRYLNQTFRSTKKTAAKARLSLKLSALIFTISPFLFRKVCHFYSSLLRKRL